ncbi:hypothetical protein M2284_002711 [Rhodococcus sp. LBL1]|nr:hypothetical protein [Rhodococcus sp. LBL1]MDH6684095.1 hypothetical protein [Rhodococcus sp. LBL2]
MNKGRGRHPTRVAATAFRDDKTSGRKDEMSCPAHRSSNRAPAIMRYGALRSIGTDSRPADRGRADWASSSTGISDPIPRQPHGRSEAERILEHLPAASGRQPWTDLQFQLERLVALTVVHACLVDDRQTGHPSGASCRTSRRGCSYGQEAVGQKGALSVAHCQSHSLKNGARTSHTNHGQSPLLCVGYGTWKVPSPGVIRIWYAGAGRGAPTSAVAATVPLPVDTVAGPYRHHPSGATGLR